MGPPRDEPDEDFAQPDDKQPGPEGFIEGVKEQPSTRFEHPVYLTKGTTLIRYMLQHIKTGDGIHRLVVEGKPFDGALMVLDFQVVFPGMFTGLLEGFWQYVCAENNGIRAGPGIHRHTRRRSPRQALSPRPIHLENDQNVRTAPG